MPGSLKTEAIVLRSIRYGEADRILHLYTPDHGRCRAIAKGVRRARSRFGARLEPFFQSRAVLPRGPRRPAHGHERRHDRAHAALRDHAATLDAAARACDAVARLFETDDPHPEVFRCSPTSSRCSTATPARAAGERARVSAEAAARGRNPAAAGGVRRLRRAEHLQRLLGRRGRRRLQLCEAAAFPLDEEAYGFLVGALGRPLAQAPRASERALRQAERAISETAEHHAHVRLRPLLAAADPNVGCQLRSTTLSEST